MPGYLEGSILAPSGAAPRLIRAINRHGSGIMSAKLPRFFRRPLNPFCSMVALQHHWHAFVDVRDIHTRFGHHHRIRRAPLLGISPDSCNGEHILIGEVEPRAGLAAGLPLHFGELRHRDWASPLGNFLDYRTLS